jgi:hypothetical protein
MTEAVESTVDVFFRRNDLYGDGDMEFISVDHGNAPTGFCVVARVLRRNANSTYTLTASSLFLTTVGMPPKR